MTVRRSSASASASRSAGSKVITTARCSFAQQTTWASATSLVPRVPSRSPPSFTRGSSSESPTHLHHAIAAVLETFRLADPGLEGRWGPMVACRALTRYRGKLGRGGGLRGQICGQRLNHLWVELGAGAAAQLAQGRLGACCISIRPLRGKCSEGDRDGDDPRPEGDPFTDESIGIAAAIEALVARPAEPCDWAHAGGGGDHPRPVEGMAVDQRGLLCAERSLLLQDRLRHGQQADVLELGGEGNVVDLLAVPPRGAGQ